MDKIAELLSNLAEKSGTTVGHLWEILTRQALIDGIVSLVQCSLLVLVTIFCYKFTGKLVENINDGTRKEAWWVAIIIGWVILVILLLIAFFSLSTIAASFVNPEFWALEHILDKFSQMKQ